MWTVVRDVIVLLEEKGVLEIVAFVLAIIHILTKIIGYCCAGFVHNRQK